MNATSKKTRRASNSNRFAPMRRSPQIERLETRWLPSTITIDHVVIAEADSGTADAIFTVSLSAASDQPVTLVYFTTDGSAQSSSDYVATSGRLTFEAGQTSGTIKVPIIGDAIPESDETFIVHVTNAGYFVTARAE